MPCGRLRDAPEETLLTDEMTRKLRDFHADTNRRGRLPKVCAFNQVESPEVFGCGGGTQHLFIDPAGAVCPCDFTPLSFGSAADEPLADIWMRMNKAMGGAPRRHCFVQKNHDLIARHAADDQFPLSPEVSKEVLEKAGDEQLPDYFQMTLSNAKGTEQ